MNLQTGQAVSCGYYRMRNNQVISVQSDNFNFSEYRNLNLCSWRFFGHHCVIRVSCPCFDLPPSSDCIGDSLKITDGYSFTQKFCGQIQPQGSYISTTNNLSILFKSDANGFHGTGFLCYVTCTGPGQMQPTTQAVTCPPPLYPGPGQQPIVNPSTGGGTGEVVIGPASTGK